MSADLLTINGNPKTAKGNSRGYLTAILHLAPASLAGAGNMCPHSTPGCRASCLNTAGRGGLFPSIGQARVRKTQELMSAPTEFLARLHKEISALVRRATREGVIPCVRLNGTSDVLWEHQKLEGRSLMQHFPAVQFYDYTKYPSRSGAKKLANYALTFSLAENNDAKACIALQSGINVSAVLHIAKGQPIPPSFTIAGQSFPMIDGDETDLRFLDPKGVVVGLRAKGKAKSDISGFVRVA